MTLAELLAVVPLALVVAVAIGASGRDTPRDVARASLHTLWTLVLVVGGVALAVRVLIAVFV
ncbi:MAG: hypothetical protein IT460_11540 [Planctomycetes bacterium]|nr:hypothetical protein [Planctomycetota bacterium]